MPRRCSICSHERLEEINRALVGNVGLRDIARQFQVGKDAASRHRADHLPATLVKAREAGEAAQADNLFGQVRDLQVRTLGILDQAEGADDPRVALAAIREARANLELLAKLLAFEHKNRRVYTHEDLKREMAIVLDVITQNVEDQATLAKVNDDLSAILEKNETV